MKLEPKHISPYAPYVLKCHAMGEFKDEHADKPEPIEFEVEGLNTGYVEIHEIGRTVTEQIPYKETFPILRPLSDLVKDEYFSELYLLIGGGWRDYETFKKGMLDHYLYTPVEAMSFRVVQLLLSMHFDCFNLIPNNLAIDINTLNQEK